MIQRLKPAIFSRHYNESERNTPVSINWSKLFYITQCVVLFALPIGAILLSITTNFLFLKEILSATFLLVLILFIKIAGGRS